MTRFYFFVSRRVDGRLKLFPLPDQLTYPNHGNTRGPMEPVNTEIEVQMNILDRNLACMYQSGTIFGVKMEGTSRRQVRLMAYSDRGRTYYKVPRIVPIRVNTDGTVSTDETLYHENRDGVRVMPDEEMIREYHYFRAGTFEEPAESESADPESSAPVETETFPVFPVGRMSKVANIGIHLTDTVVNPSAANQTKYNISLLLDMLATGGARFTFRKQNGETRLAVGTLREDIVTEIDAEAMNDPRERTAEESHDGAHVVYFDIEKHGWRSFCTEDFLSLDPERLGKAECLRLASN